jgi:hypothetical protein
MALLDAAEESARWLQVIMEVGRTALEAGGTFSVGRHERSAPYDFIGDTLRGTKGIVMDMCRCGE